MATPYDSSINVVQEATYGTYVAPTRAMEYVDEGLDWQPNRVQGVGLRVASRIARSARRVTTTVQGGGSLSVEATTKGLGLLLDSALGTSAATLVSGTTYQHNFTLGDTPKSLTIQKSIPEAGGTIDPYSFLGCMVNSWTFTSGNGEISKFSFDFDIRDLDTAQTFATLTYPSSPNLYHFALGAVTIGGSVTAPTTTAIATGGTSVSDVRSFELTCNNNLKDDRYNFGGAGKKSKPTVGLRAITGKFTAEYTATTYRSAFVADTELPITLTLTSAEALSSGTATLQIVLPAVKLDAGVPMSNNGELITVEHSFTVLDNLTATQPIWVVLRTADSAI